MPKSTPDLEPGEVFGELTIVKKMTVRKGSSNKTAYMCKCSCGKHKIGFKSRLKKGSLISCGCKKSLRKEVIVKNFKYVTGHYFSTLKNSAKIRKLTFNITKDFLDELFEKQNGLCAFTGDLLDFKTDKNRCGQIASVDRINSNIGYENDNVQWVHKQTNWIKWTFDQDYFINLCKFVANYNIGKDIYKMKNFIITNKAKRLILHNELPRIYVSRLKILSSRRKLSFNINKQYLDNLFLEQNKQCALTGLDLSFDADPNGNYQTASLDRIDSSIGYEQGNVQWVHKDINMMKKDMDQKDFIELCKKIAQYRS